VGPLGTLKPFTYRNCQRNAFLSFAAGSELSNSEQWQNGTGSKPGARQMRTRSFD
jgi:hypothetical protein